MATKTNMNNKLTRFFLDFDTIFPLRNLKIFYLDLDLSRRFTNGRAKPPWRTNSLVHLSGKEYLRQFDFFLEIHL